MVWLKAGLVLRHTQVVTRQIQADFLSGGITSSHLGDTAPALAPALRANKVGHSNDYVCSLNQHIPACQNKTDVCVSFFCGGGASTLCPSGAFNCGATHGCSHGIECSVLCP